MEGVKVYWIGHTIPTARHLKQLYKAFGEDVEIVRVPTKDPLSIKMILKSEKNAKVIAPYKLDLLSQLLTVTEEVYTFPHKERTLHKVIDVSVQLEPVVEGD